MHLIIYFAGSGEVDDESLSFYKDFASYITRETMLLSIAGCKHPEVCNTLYFPDLKRYAKRFVQKMFLNTGNRFVLKNAEEAKVGYFLSSSQELSPGTEITSVTLCGHSRGAVTCFEVAKQLNQLAPQLPVDIVADQPVPGNCYETPGTNAASIADCRDLTNVRNVSVILGSCTGGYEYNYLPFFNKIKNLYRSLRHLAFFSQILPKLPIHAKRCVSVIPKSNHDEKDSDDAHLHMQVAKSLLENRTPKLC